MEKVTIYGKPQCPYCDMAVTLCEQRGFDFEYIDIQAREILAMRARLNEIMARHTGQSLETIARDTERDNFKSAVEAQAYGLVDQVLERRPDESIQAG
mgnify:CR=1 FL=1